MRDHGTMGALREQSALLDADEKLFVKIGKTWHRVILTWPDTSMAPCGQGFYLEVEEKPVRRDP